MQVLDDIREGAKAKWQAAKDTARDRLTRGDVLSGVAPIVYDSPTQMEGFRVGPSLNWHGTLSNPNKLSPFFNIVDTKRHALDPYLRAGIPIDIDEINRRREESGLMAPVQDTAPVIPATYTNAVGFDMGPSAIIRSIPIIKKDDNGIGIGTGSIRGIVDNKGYTQDMRSTLSGQFDRATDSIPSWAPYEIRSAYEKALQKARNAAPVVNGFANPDTGEEADWFGGYTRPQTAWITAHEKNHINNNPTSKGKDLITDYRTLNLFSDGQGFADGTYVGDRNFGPMEGLQLLSSIKREAADYGRHIDTPEKMRQELHRIYHTPDAQVHTLYPESQRARNYLIRSVRDYNRWHRDRHLDPQEGYRLFSRVNDAVVDAMESKYPGSRERLLYYIPGYGQQSEELDRMYEEQERIRDRYTDEYSGEIPGYERPDPDNHPVFQNIVDQYAKFIPLLVQSQSSGQPMQKLASWLAKAAPLSQRAMRVAKGLGGVGLHMAPAAGAVSMDYIKNRDNYVPDDAQSMASRAAAIGANMLTGKRALRSTLAAGRAATRGLGRTYRNFSNGNPRIGNTRYTNKLKRDALLSSAAYGGSFYTQDALDKGMGWTQDYVPRAVVHLAKEHPEQTERLAQFAGRTAGTWADYTVRNAVRGIGKGSEYVPDDVMPKPNTADLIEYAGLMTGNPKLQSLDEEQRQWLAGKVDTGEISIADYIRIAQMLSTNQQLNSLTNEDIEMIGNVADNPGKAVIPGVRHLLLRQSGAARPNTNGK